MAKILPKTSSPSNLNIFYVYILKQLLMKLQGSKSGLWPISCFLSLFPYFPRTDEFHQVVVMKVIQEVRIDAILVYAVLQLPFTFQR